MDANTDLGQHFMVDTPLLKRIVELARITSDDVVLEIGSGPGALTKVLASKTSQLITVEIDERFPATHHGNILQLIDEISFNAVVSNLPYHICEPLFIAFTLYQPKKIIVVVGDAFASHLQEETILGSVFRELYDIVYEQPIAPESFNPPPQVRSALISCCLKSQLGILADFYQYPKSKVKNYFKTKMTKKEAQEFINKLPVSLQEKRLYELNKKEFLEVKKVLQTM